MHLEEMRRVLMAKHLRSDKIGRERLNILIQNVNGLIREPGDDVLRRQFVANLKNHEAA